MKKPKSHIFRGFACVFLALLVMSGMVGLSVLSMGIVNIFLGTMGYDATLARQSTSTETGMVIAYLCMDMIGFALSVILLWRMDVEKYTDSDKARILERQKAAAGRSDR